MLLSIMDLKRVLVGHGHHGRSYFDASTAELLAAAFLKWFKELDEFGAYEEYNDDGTAVDDLDLKDQVRQLAELTAALDAGSIPEALRSDAENKIFELSRVKANLDQWEAFRDLYLQARLGSEAAARKLLELRKDYDSEGWSLCVVR